MTTRVRLTVRRVEDAPSPAAGETYVHDTDAPGLSLRVRASGGKSWLFTYRTEGGRAGKVRRVTLGAWPKVGLDEARREARRLSGEVATGADPVAEAKQAAKAADEAARREAARMTLAPALNAYEASLTRRAVRDRANVLSALRRRLLGPVVDGGGAGDDTSPHALGDVPLDQIDRASVMRVVNAVDAAGLPSAAAALRQRATAFLSWCVDQGFIRANPLAGMRRQRATRAERIERPGRPGRMLGDAELAALWRACVGLGRSPRRGQQVLAAVVQVLLLTGQRRTETARMRWEDLDEARSWWTIPAAEAKNGEPHQVPLPPAVRAVIEAQPIHAGCPWVFTSDGRAPVSGWSKLEPKLREAAAKEGVAGAWTLHDLRRSFRSGLTRLRIEPDLAEIMINHRPEKLRAIYDREPRLAERAAVADRWAAHLLGVVENDPDAAKIIRLDREAAA